MRSCGLSFVFFSSLPIGKQEHNTSHASVPFKLIDRGKRHLTTIFICTCLLAVLFQIPTHKSQFTLCDLMTERSVKHEGSSRFFLCLGAVLVVSRKLMDRNLLSIYQDCICVEIESERSSSTAAVQNQSDLYFGFGSVAWGSIHHKLTRWHFILQHLIDKY